MEHHFIVASGHVDLSARFRGKECLPIRPRLDLQPALSIAVTGTKYSIPCRASSAAILLASEDVSR